MERGALDVQGPGEVIADEEDRSTTLAGGVVPDHGAGDRQGVQVAVGVDGRAAATARAAGAGRVGAPADGLVAGHDAVEDHPGHPDAAESAAVGADTTAERAAHDVDRQVVVLAPRPDR